jgi:two-component system, NarL family, sensor kinase
MRALLGACAVVAGLVGAGLHAANAAADRVLEPSFWLMGCAAAVGYGAVALLLRGAWAVRVPVLLGAVGLVQGLSLLLTEWGFLGPDVLLREWALWLGSWVWAPGYAAIAVLLPLLLPDGRLPGRRWRPALWLAVATLGLSSATWALSPYDSQDFPEALGDASNPVGVEVMGGSVVWNLSGLLALAALVAAFAALAVRWRRSADVERQQLKWVVLGYVATIVLLAAARLLPVEVSGVVTGLAMLPLPLAIGVAVLRHGLWEVDLVISRSLVYALLSVGVAGVYVFAVWLLGDAAGATTGAPILATTVVALLAIPAHSWLQRHVNRLVHGDAEEPNAVLARLGERLASAAAPDEIADRVLPSVVEQLARSLRAAQVTLVLRDGSVTSYGDDGGGDVLTVPLVHAGERLGDLTASRPAGFDETAVATLDRLGAQAAVAARTVLLARDSQRAREEIVLAREEERRQLRRDLHDGVGPALAALALHAETARDLAVDDPGTASRLLDRLVPRLNAAVADVRALVHEMRPPMLDELGLGEAVVELADRLGTGRTPVVVDESHVGELPAAVEVAAYRIASEAVGNAVRHAGASTVRVGLHDSAGTLVLTVVDDGSGIPAGARPRPDGGLGLTSMRDRAEEVGGSLEVRTGADGTTVVATLPTTGQPAAPTRVTAAGSAEVMVAGSPREVVTS